MQKRHLGRDRCFHRRVVGQRNFNENIVNSREGKVQCVHSEGEVILESQARCRRRYLNKGLCCKVSKRPALVDGIRFKNWVIDQVRRGRKLLNVRAALQYRIGHWLNNGRRRIDLHGFAGDGDCCHDGHCLGSSCCSGWVLQRCYSKSERVGSLIG